MKEIIVRVFEDTPLKPILIEKKENDFVVIGEAKKLNRSLRISFLPEELEIKDIEINNKIKKSLIPSVLKAKIAKETETDFVFRHYLKEKNENTSVYTVEIIKKAEVFKALSHIQNKEIIKYITTDYHALFAISKKYFDDDFISIYIDEKEIIYIMGKENLKFFRQNALQEPQESANDINRTILYFKQQSKKMNLDKILISGNIDIIDKILPFLNIPISMPLNFHIKNISNEDFIQNFLIFGICEDGYNFLPEEFKQIKIFKLTYLFVVAALITIILYFSYTAYEKYSDISFNKSVLQNRKTEFEILKKKTKLLPQKKLDYYISFINTVLKEQKSNYINQISKAAPLANLLKTDNILVGPQIRIEFSKKYKNFKSLIYQREKIKEILKKINEKYKLTTDYENKTIKLILFIKRNDD